jgi:hypothetical protein
MKKQILLNMIKIILFLFFLSACWMIYSTGKNIREGFAPAKCSELGDCKACAGIVTSVDGICTWDSRMGLCRRPTPTDDANYSSTLPACSARTTGFAAGYSLGTTPADAIWTNPNFGCPVCPTLYDVNGGSKMTAQSDTVINI